MSKFDAANVDRMERMYASAPMAEQRARTRAALALSPGDHGLEIGCGIGFLACEMAREVGATGHVVGLDNSPDMIAAAQKRAEREGLSDRLEFVVGDAKRLDFPSTALDFVVAVQVYLAHGRPRAAPAGAGRALVRAWPAAFSARIARSVSTRGNRPGQRRGAPDFEPEIRA